MNISIALGEQSAKGVRATTFKQIYATDFSITPDVSVAQSNALTGSRFFQGASFVSRINIAGDIPFEATPETLMFLIKNAGFKLVGDKYVASDKCDKWLSVLCDYVGEEAHEIIKDVKINSLTISLATESFVTGTINIVGCDSEFLTTAFSGTVEKPTDEQLICLNSAVSFGAEDRSALLSDATITINNNLEGASAINNIYNTDIRESNADATLDVTYNRFDKTIYKAGFDSVLQAQSVSAKIVLGTGVEGEGIEIVCPKAKPVDNTATELSGFGAMTQSYNLAFDNTLQSPISFKKLTPAQP
ncbi:MAG: phage tail tube protein [Peptostreptococcaceae bacterium]